MAALLAVAVEEAEDYAIPLDDRLVLVDQVVQVV